MKASPNGSSTDSPEGRRAFLGKTALGLAVAGFTELLRPAAASAMACSAGVAGDVKEIRDSAPLIRIGVFDAAFKNLSTEQLIELIKELKIEAVEIGTGNDPGSPHCDREALLADDARGRGFLAQ